MPCSHPLSFLRSSPRPVGANPALPNYLQITTVQNVLRPPSSPASRTSSRLVQAHRPKTYATSDDPPFSRHSDHPAPSSACSPLLLFAFCGPYHHTRSPTDPVGEPDRSLKPPSSWSHTSSAFRSDLRARGAISSSLSEPWTNSSARAVIRTQRARARRGYRDPRTPNLRAFRVPPISSLPWECTPSDVTERGPWVRGHEPCDSLIQPVLLSLWLFPRSSVMCLRAKWAIGGER